MATLAITGVHHVPRGDFDEQFGEVGFTQQHATTLTRIEVQLTAFRDEFSRRMTMVENERAHRRELTQLEEQVRENRTRQDALNEKLDTALDALDRRVVWVYAFAAGAAFFGGGLVAVVSHFWK